MITRFTKFLKVAACITCLLIATNSANAQTWPPAGMSGNGTQSNPWQIATIAHLTQLATYVNAGNGSQTIGKYYKLMNDVSYFINTYPFPLFYICEPIGNCIVNDAIFQGNFDGNGKKVFNAYINKNSTPWFVWCCL